MWKLADRIGCRKLQNAAARMLSSDAEWRERCLESGIRRHFYFADIVAVERLWDDTILEDDPFQGLETEHPRQGAFVDE